MHPLLHCTISPCHLELALTHTVSHPSLSCLHCLKPAHSGMQPLPPHTITPLPSRACLHHLKPTLVCILSFPVPSHTVLLTTANTALMLPSPWPMPSLSCTSPLHCCCMHGPALTPSHMCAPAVTVPLAPSCTCTALMPPLTCMGNDNNRVIIIIINNNGQVINDNTSDQPHPQGRDSLYQTRDNVFRIGTVLPCLCNGPYTPSWRASPGAKHVETHSTKCHAIKSHGRSYSCTSGMTSTPAIN